MCSVKAWYEDVVIPTYETGEYEKNPVFLEKRVYQGSSGVVYPYPVIEKIYDEKTNRTWKAIFLENDYLKIMILPELGGRVQMAFDKIKQRHFVYYNQVIKPALVGLTGPWISGGIEFNWPQHHRPSTYEPVDYTIEENDDGSKTVWCSEIERMFRTKGMAGFTLYPDNAYLEIKVKLFNRTPFPQTFLWWANPAVKVNEHYQSVFPPDVHAVFDHGKRDVSTFPIATGTYYKVDYSAGVDISRYKNIPVPTSYMAVSSEYNFIGCYENDTDGGMLHVADHHISPGKKQWTWGNGEFGYAWDRNLTDEDGPYIELMCGVYTDNQPDFSWLMPAEEKSFSQYFMPYREIGIVKNATKEALVNLDIRPRQIEIKIYVTATYKQASIRLKHNDITIYEQTEDLSPLNVFHKCIDTDGTILPEQAGLTVKNKDGKLLVSWKPGKKIEKPVPEPAKAAKEPSEIESNEQLYLTGLHLEQYRHATYSPADYYNEALKRDKNDSRCNNAMGLLKLKCGDFTGAEGHFRTAIDTLTALNPNPYIGEPFYNLGISLRFQHREDEAFDAFYKSVWNDAWQASGYFQLSQIATKDKNYVEALELIDKSIIKQFHNHRARHLKVSLLRLTGKKDEAIGLIGESLKIDKFNTGCYYERYLLTGSAGDLALVYSMMGNNIHHYIEIALDYAWAGLFSEASSLLKTGIDKQKNKVYPMAWYYLGWFYSLSGQQEKAVEFYNKAEKEHPQTCFPNQLESVLAFNSCILLLDKPDKAHYYLGNFNYHNKQYKLAIYLWEKSAEYFPGYPTVHRNLALGYYNKANKKEQALLELEKAFELDQSDARVLMELDALYKRFNKGHGDRLKFLGEHAGLVGFRDDLYLEKITLLNFTGKHDEAFQLISKRKFHPWEGGEGKVTGQYTLTLVEWAKEYIKKKQYPVAIEKIEESMTYPYNLGEGKLHGAQENDLNFWIGYCYEQTGNMEFAEEYYQKASVGLKEPSPALFYNDQQPEKIFYQGLALSRLNKFQEAEERFQVLIKYGEKHIDDKIKMDYFAVSLPDLMIWDDDLSIRNKQHCMFLLALGKLGLARVDEAEKYLKDILKNDLYHEGAYYHLKAIREGLFNFLTSDTN